MYDFWHDRAAFHFLTDENDIKNYLSIISKHIKPDGIFVITPFLKKGLRNPAGLKSNNIYIFTAYRRIEKWRI